MGANAALMLALALYSQFFRGVTSVTPWLLCAVFSLSAMPEFVPTENGVIAGIFRITAIIYSLGVVVYVLLFF